MLWVPTLKALVVQIRRPAVAAAARVTALQPLIALPSLAKATVPVGLLPVTVAVKVTLVPATAGLAELPAWSCWRQASPPTPQASISVIARVAAERAVTLIRMRSVVNAAKLTVRFTRLLPLTLASTPARAVPPLHLERRDRRTS
jgi:hypothetical protein